MSENIRIKLGAKGNSVEKWQVFLQGQGLYLKQIDAVFGQYTLEATIAFQKKYNLEPDGIVGNKTYGAAMLLNFDGTHDPYTDLTSSNWPPRPTNLDPISEANKKAWFNEIIYKHTPSPNDSRHISITNGWEERNIISTTIPQLASVYRGNVKLHKYIERQTKKLFQDWDDAGLVHLILMWDSMYEARLISSGSQNLSCHAYGIAFDINVPWNSYGGIPALVGQKGSVRELVTIANRNGFFWGGHFNPQKFRDGMHFEVAKIINP